MAWVLTNAYRDRVHGLIVVWVSIDGAPPRMFSWSIDDPRLYQADGVTLRSRRAIIDGMKVEIRQTLQAEAAATPALPDLESYPGAGEAI